MNLENNKSVKVGYQISIIDLVFLMFLYLKLTGQGVVATWSWWMITSPYWIYIAIAILLYIVVSVNKKQE
jgi:hypothetical protein